MIRMKITYGITYEIASVQLHPELHMEITYGNYISVQLHHEI